MRLLHGYERLDEGSLVWLTCGMPLGEEGAAEEPEVEDQDEWGPHNNFTYRQVAGEGSWQQPKHGAVVVVWGRLTGRSLDPDCGRAAAAAHHGCWCCWVDGWVGGRGAVYRTLDMAPMTGIRAGETATGRHEGGKRGLGTAAGGCWDMV